MPNFFGMFALGTAMFAAAVTINNVAKKGSGEKDAKWVRRGPFILTTSAWGRVDGSLVAEVVAALW
jgi:hypothetical protein